MKSLKNHHLKRSELYLFKGGGGPFDPSACDPSLIPDADGGYTKYTGGNENCSNGVSVVLKDREKYNSAGDLTSSVEVYVHNGGL